MIIGRFSESSDGTLVGHIRTMFFKSDKVVFEPIPPSSNPKAPVFRIYTGDEIELGAAWRKVGGDGVVWYEVTLDDPTFANPVHCNPAARRRAMATSCFGIGHAANQSRARWGCAKACGRATRSKRLPQPDKRVCKLSYINQPLSRRERNPFIAPRRCAK